MKSYWSLANIISLGNLLSGTVSIFFSVNHRFHSAAIWILAGVLFDFLDGKIARRTGQTSEFGKALDSLSDVVTFGIATAALAASCIQGPLDIAILFLFVSAGAWRLAYYIQWREKKRPPGMPITFNGIFFPLAFLARIAPPFLFALFALSVVLMVGPIVARGPEVS